MALPSNHCLLAKFKTLLGTAPAISGGNLKEVKVHLSVVFSHLPATLGFLQLIADLS